MNCLLCGFIERWVETNMKKSITSFLRFIIFRKITLYNICFPDDANNVLVSNLFALQDRTNNLFKQVYEQKSLKGRANDAIASACLYIACRQEGVPRTFKGQSEPFYFL